MKYMLSLSLLVVSVLGIVIFAMGYEQTFAWLFYIIFGYVAIVAGMDVLKHMPKDKKKN